MENLGGKRLFLEFAFFLSFYPFFIKRFLLRASFHGAVCNFMEIFISQKFP